MKIHLTLDNIYDFYNKLTERERTALIGKIIKENRPNYQVIYFPVGLINKWENYGVAQGLISVHPAYEIPYPSKNKRYFKVSVFSPDDLDMDLEFYDEETKYRKKVIRFIKNYNKNAVMYRGMLMAIQDFVKCGTMG